MRQKVDERAQQHFCASMTLWGSTFSSSLNSLIFSRVYDRKENGANARERSPKTTVTCKRRKYIGPIHLENFARLLFAKVIRIRNLPAVFYRSLFKSHAFKRDGRKNHAPLLIWKIRLTRRLPGSHEEYWACCNISSWTSHHILSIWRLWRFIFQRTSLREGKGYFFRKDLNWIDSFVSVFSEENASK